MNTELSAPILSNCNTGETKMPITAIEAPVAPATAGFNFNAMRLPANYSAGLGVKKVLNKVPVGKPGPAIFFRTREGEAWTFRAFIYNDKEANETYIVLPFMQPLFGNLARPAQLYAAIDRTDNPLLIPVILPSEGGHWNSWHESLSQCVDKSKKYWVRLESNKPINAYDICQATGVLSEPEWPDTTMEELVKIAFRGKIVDNPDHPVIQALQGAV